ncbi:Ribonuclease H domain [Forsythia ovata]|uniref:Ribonuclease H domain n=1 Tax=Forsythia ovata TaxID=205694 RepID=A0ABD1WPH2_9LAMI
MAVFARTFTGNFAVMEAELIALREGLEFALRHNFQLESAEVDSLSIVQELESDFTFSPLAELLHDVSTLIQQYAGPHVSIFLAKEILLHTNLLRFLSLCQTHFGRIVSCFFSRPIFGVI